MKFRDLFPNLPEKELEEYREAWLAYVRLVIEIYETNLDEEQRATYFGEESSVRSPR